MIVAQVQNDRATPSRTEIHRKRYGESDFQRERFRPYFYVDSGEHYELPDGTPGDIERGVETAYDGTNLDRVVLHSTRDMKDAKQEAGNHYEADIPFERRYYVDEVDMQFEDDHPHILHVDIETGSDGGGVDAMAVNMPVISISTYSEDREKHIDFLLRPGDCDDAGDGHAKVSANWDGAGGSVHVYDREEDLLSAFATFINDIGAEVITGWNVDSFDCVYLINRMAYLGDCHEAELSPLDNAYVSEWGEDPHAHIKGIDVFDYMAAYKRVKRRDKPANWRLETAAEHEGLDVGKIDMDGSRMLHEWKDDHWAVMRYNRRDTLLTVRLDEKMELMRQFLTMHRELAVPLRDTVNNSVLVEMFVMSRAPEWDTDRVILNSKHTEDNDFEGGKTLQPDPGRYDNVFSVDVTSEYPNWVRAANISPETALTDEDIEHYIAEGNEPIDSPVNGVAFRNHDDRLGLLPRAVDEMFYLKSEKTEKRDQYEPDTHEYKQAKRERRTAKELLNSIQGVSGMESHRLSNNAVAASITAFGRATVAYMVEEGEHRGYEHVYGDTDSAFFHDPSGDEVETVEDAIEACKQLSDVINDKMPEWAAARFGVPEDRATYLEVEPDKVARRAFFPDRKKRYTLMLAWKDGDRRDNKVSHTGWAHVKKDASDVEARVQRNALEAIIRGWSEDEVTEKAREEVQRIRDGEYEPMQMARSVGTSDPLEEYGDSPRVDFEGVTTYQVTAMISSNHLLDTDWQGGESAYVLPVKETRSVRIGESSNRVNYVAIDEDTNLDHDWLEIDTDKVIDQVTGKLRSIYRSLGWNLDEVTRTSETLDTFV